MTIAYHGKLNNYSSLAVKDFASKAKLTNDAIPISTYEELLASNHEFCFLAVQNSSHTLADMFSLIAKQHWNVVGEYYWSTPLQLVGTGTDLKSIEHVVVVGHIASVCKQYLESKKVHVIHVEDTAEACDYIVTKKLNTYAAIAPKETAQHYKLNTLVERVDDPNSLTRFFLVSKQEQQLKGNQPFKTTLIVRIQNRTGCLHKVLNIYIVYWMFCY